MRFRFYLNPETGEPHILDHGVSERDVEDVLDDPIENRIGEDGVFVATGKTRGGRWLRVIYRWDLKNEAAFVITAFRPAPKTVRASRRRQKKNR